MALTVSPTSAPWLASCLRRFHTLGVLRKFPTVEQPPPILRFAIAVHSVFKGLYDPCVPGDLPHTDNLDTILRLAFLQAGYKDEADKLFDIERTRKLVRTYLAQADGQDDSATVAVERAGTFPVRVGGEVLYEITARLDRVIHLKDVCIGIDYKLGARLPPIESILINLAAMKAAYPNFKRYEFWIEALSDTEVERTIYRGEEMRGAIHTLTAQVRRYLNAKEYPAEPCEGCVWCPLRADCQGTQGQAVDEEDLDF